MKELLYKARREIKRADHLIYVSLKYTRTVDMFIHIIERIINSLGFTMDALLKHANKRKKSKELPKSQGMKAEKTREAFPEDETINCIVDFYLFLRQVLIADYTKAREYRRHVTMTAQVNGTQVDINIDIIHELFDKTKEYVDYVENLLLGKNE